MNNSKILIAFLTALMLVSSSFAEDNSASDKLNTMIEKGMKDWQIPGLSTVVVKNGKVVFKKVYGIKDIESKELVDENTLFSMGSTTKALIAISLGILVDQNKINWQDKVVDHYPSFKLSDPYITANARVKDLLTHNLGIGNADLLWLLNNLSTTDTLEKFKYAKNTYPMRGGFTYQNVMYAVAGELIESVSEQHWTDFVDNEILKPLEMNRTQTKSVDIKKIGNYTAPHNSDSGDSVIKLSQTFSDQIGAAGMIWSNTNDISNYLMFLVNDGVFNGKSILKPATFNYLFKPHSILDEDDIYPTKTLTKPNWSTYGLGWFQQDYRGTKLNFHSGSLPGLVAMVGVMRDKDTAVYVFANLDHAELRHAIMYKALDLYAFNDDKKQWHKDIFKLYSGIKANAKEATKKKNEERVKNTSPTLSLDQYTGTYQNEMLGTVSISMLKDQLHIDFNNHLKFKMQHWHYDIFKTNKDPKWQFELMINFHMNTSGKIQELDVFGEKYIKETVKNKD